MHICFFDASYRKIITNKSQKYGWISPYLKPISHKNWIPLHSRVALSLAHWNSKRNTYCTEPVDLSLGSDHTKSEIKAV